MGLAENNFFRLKAWNVAACLIAVLAMSASAVAACACSHHQPLVKAEEKPSCHSASHAEPAVSLQDLPESNSLHSGCNCFVNDRIPAITAKSDSKKFSAAKMVTADSSVVSTIAVLSCSSAVSTNVESPNFIYSGTFLASGPSRAPPRL